MEISVVIPAYNEQGRIKETLERISSYFSGKKIHHEIIVIDDGSTDKTAEIVEEFREFRNKNAGKNKNADIVLLRNKTNMGKGFSVKKGVLNAKLSFLLISDADLSTPIEEAEKLLKYSQYDIVIGSRALDRNYIKKKQPFYRDFSGRIFNLFVRMLVLKGFKDTQCGFKLFRADAAKKIFSRQRTYGYCFDVEILFIAAKNSYKIKEVPVLWYNKEESKVSMLLDPLKMFFDLLRIRVNGVLGAYDAR